MSPAATCRLLRAGINDTYLVADGSLKQVFRVYSLDWRTREEIMEEIRLLNLLQERAVSVSYPLPDKEGNYIQLLHAPEGDRFGVLFSFAAGHKIHSFSTDTHFQIGKLMARFHAVTTGQSLQRITYTPEVLLVNSLIQLEDFLPADTREMAYMQSFQPWLLEEWRQADLSRIRQGIVHLDIWFDNLNIGEGDQVTLFDFDFCGNGWLCLDLAYYILQLHNTEKYEAAAYQPKIAGFLAGYESITSLSEEEKRLIPMLGICLYFFYLGNQCRRFDNWSNSFLSEDYLKRFINGLVKRYSEIYNLGNPEPASS